MMCVASFRSVVGFAACVVLCLSACAAEPPASRADSGLNVDVVRPVAARDPEAVRDAREAAEEAVQRISGLASAAVSVVRELGQEAARSVSAGRDGDAAAANEVEALADMVGNEIGAEQ